MNLSPRVLVIDESSDTEMVLRAVLEPQGTSVGRRRNQLHASESTSSSRPEVVVIDLDGQSDAQLATAAWQSSPRVLIGTHRPAVANQRERFLEKPFQYPELVRVIQELLDGQDAA